MCLREERRRDDRGSHESDGENNIDGKENERTEEKMNVDIDFEEEGEEEEEENPISPVKEQAPRVEPQGRRSRNDRPGRRGGKRKRRRGRGRKR